MTTQTERSYVVDKDKAEAIKREYSEAIDVQPDVYQALQLMPLPEVVQVTRKQEQTLHEGQVLYLKYWNFWTRAGVQADPRSLQFFPDYENPHARIMTLLTDIGLETQSAISEEVIWERVAVCWQWMREHVDSNHAAYSSITTQPAPHWPSIHDFAVYFETHGRLAWAACFSKAHLFATLLGRAGIPRWRLAVASAHHTINGVPPTASHVYVALYIAEQWLYLDPTAVYAVPEIPTYHQRMSVGLFDEVDYCHPFIIIPLPLSEFTRIPLLETHATTATRYIANRASKEIHDLYRVTERCHHDLIREDNKMYLNSLHDVEQVIQQYDYNGCHWCMPEYSTD